MKVKGKAPKASDPKPCVFTRASKDDTIVIMVYPVPDKVEFRKRFPDPEPRKRHFANGRVELLLDDPVYKQALLDHSTLHSNWLVLTSIKANTDTDGVCFDTVKLDDSSTWGNWEQEMRDNGFVEGEIAYLVREVGSICGYNSVGFAEARESFLLETLLEPAQASPAVAAIGTQSGELASDGASSRLSLKG